ncbi:nuclear transcription factor Y subunit B-3-like [Andrographis paniculata]|uniref:nuclear transcription factor Y subunit B-3-like n=1 Tax=Andrographis paniculata TaxID=175694 RepID=UPI0021E7482C|nr:nuclear transcription factor Y subunit B-3-like [Andrographis paniculata]
MADSDNESGGNRDHSSQNEASPREQDRFLPIANVSRIMKKALPANAKISKDAKETVQECVSEFISFITGEASDKCQREKRKTINGDDLLWAMTTLGFEEYVEPLKVYLQRFRDMEGEKSAIAGRGDKETIGVGGGGGGNGSVVNLGTSGGGDGYEGMYGVNMMGGSVYGYGQSQGIPGKVGSSYNIGSGSGTGMGAGRPR